MYWIGGLWIVLTAGFGQVIPWLLGAAVDGIRNQSDDLAFFCGAIVVAALVQGFFRYRMRLDIIGASRNIEFDLRRDLYSHLLKLSPSYYDASRTGDLMTRSSSDLEAVRQVVGPAFMYFSNTALIVVSSLVLMLLIDVQLTLYALLPMTLLSVVVRVLGKKVHERTLEAQAQESKMTARLQETMAGIRVVKAYVQQDHELDSFASEARELVGRNMRLVRVWGFFFPSMALIVGAGAILTLWIGGQRVMAHNAGTGGITLGDFVAFNAYLTRLTWPMISIGWVLNLLERGAASLARINEIWNTEPQIRSGPLHPAQPMRGEIQFDKVSFAYGGAGQVLHDIDLRVEAGETVAIVGPTGSGKSTLLALVARLYDPTQGRVRIDGHDIRELPLDWLRGGLGMVPQETFLFSDTLRNNIEFGISVGERQDAESGHRLDEATGIAQLQHTIRDFPAGLDTILGERGITLSGGQKQRTAIARAILRNPRILLLDDCLSSVDTETEEEILRGLRRVMQERTSLIVAHRISTVRNADRVVVLDDGRIIEQGSHAQLMQHQGYYARLVERQRLREELEKDAFRENA